MPHKLSSPTSLRHPSQRGSCQVCGGTYATIRHGLRPRVVQHGWTNGPAATPCDGSSCRPYPEAITRLRRYVSASSPSSQRERLFAWRYQTGDRIQVRSFLPFVDQPNFDCIIYRSALLERDGTGVFPGQSAAPIMEWLEDATSAAIVLALGDTPGTTQLFFAWPVDAVQFELRWGAEGKTVRPAITDWGSNLD